MALQLGTIGILLSSLAALVLLSVGGLLCFRDAILSVVAARVLARRGIRCGPISLRLPLALPPSPIVLAATRCELAEGPLAAIAFKEPLSIQLDGFTVGPITCASVEVDLRPRLRREVELNTLGDLTPLVGLEQAALDLMFDTAALSSQKAPPRVRAPTHGSSPAMENMVSRGNWFSHHELLIGPDGEPDLERRVGAREGPPGAHAGQLLVEAVVRRRLLKPREECRRGAHGGAPFAGIGRDPGCVLDNSSKNRPGHTGCLLGFSRIIRQFHCARHSLKDILMAPVL